MLKVTFEIVPFGDADHQNRREIGHLNIGLQKIKPGDIGEYVSYMTTDGQHAPPNPVIQIFDHKRADGAFTLVQRALEAHHGSEHPEALPNDSEAILEALRAQSEHVCGLQGYDPVQDPICPGCEPANVLTCPHCSNDDPAEMMGVEYPYGHPQRYDGVSEWRCLTCKTRWGRWSGKILGEGQCERRFGRS